MEGEPSTKLHRAEGSKVDAATKEMDIANGPFSLLNSAVNNRSEVSIVCRDGRRLFARVRAFDKHYNMLLMDVSELVRRHNSASEFETRHLPSLFLRGDTVVYVTPSVC